MQFRQGMLGVAVLAVAIAGALIGAWVMSMDVEEREVINFSPLTDITGLFDTEMAPQFTDYSPSSNYTGYWTSTSVDGETRYFDGVDYTPASAVFKAVAIPSADVIVPPIGLHTIPENQGVLNVIKRCRQLTDIEWTPAVDLPRLMYVSSTPPSGDGYDVTDVLH